MSKLDPERVRQWFRLDRTKAEQYVMQVENLVTDVGELRAAIDAGMSISIFSGPVPKSQTTSLSFLAPVIGELRDLSLISAGRFTDLEVLNGATNLRSLNYEVGPSRDRVDLAGLPRFEEFTGVLTRTVASVVENPGLRFLSIYGPKPAPFARVVGPVEIFSFVGARSQTVLPVFEHPKAMRSMTRVSPSRFDLAQLGEMTGLTEIKVGACDDVVGLSAMALLPKLNSVTFQYCGTAERWEDVPRVAEGFLMAVSPFPSVAFLEERRAAGWIVPQLWEGEPVEALTVDESADGEGWGVYMSRFDDLADAVELLDGSAPDGLHGESLILGVVAELNKEGARLDAEPDSEGSFTAVYFPDQAQAEQVYARAKDVLASDASAQLAYLRNAH
ncbi:hypothetical protein ACI2IP_00645 [Microbacterium sp. NPDC090218]